tara:strand:+ start:1374 stop:1610 length:237 start_codon:yes stop_codon:yes gene_type:complete
MIESMRSAYEYKRFISEEMKSKSIDAPDKIDFSTNLCDTYRKTKASFEEKVEQSLKYLNHKETTTDEVKIPENVRRLK